MALVLSSCGVRRQARRPDPQVVQSVPVGAVSRFATLQVSFARARPEARPGEQVRPQPFSFSPAIAGTARWADERTLEFVPARPLPAGRRFRASVSMPGERAFDFAFSVIRPDIEVSFEGLEVEEADPDSYLLAGTVLTADREEPARIEKVLRARLCRQ